MALHDDEYPIDVALVRDLLERSMPQLAGRALSPLRTQGSSNALLRLGDDLIVRLPRQPGGSATILKEARWLPRIAEALPVAVPEIIDVGKPGPGYPEHWLVTRWIDGRVPEGASIDGPTSCRLASDLAGVVSALRRLPVPSEAMIDPDLRWYRGEPLRCFDAEFHHYLVGCRNLPLDLDLDACERVWDAATALPAARVVVEPQWLHGDLAAENLLMDGDRLVAVLDFGALSVGDPTVDLVVAWEMLSPAEREVFRDELAIDDARWELGRAWALALAIMTFPYYWDTMPGRCAARLGTARAVLADAARSD